jgi:magnesium and cobalt transporter
MSDDRSNGASSTPGWISKFGTIFSREPRTRQDLADAVSVAVDNELIDDDARSIIEGALQVSDMQVRDIMVPKAQMIVIKEDSSLEEILPQIISSAHSRYPVVGESPGCIAGQRFAAPNTKPGSQQFQDVGFTAQDYGGTRKQKTQYTAARISRKS